MKVRTNNLVQFDWNGPANSGIRGTVFVDGTANTYELDDVDVVAVLEYALTARSKDDLRTFARDSLECDTTAADDLLDTLIETGFLLPDDHENFVAYRTWMEKGWQRALFYHLRTRTADVERPTPPDDREGTTRSGEPLEPPSATARDGPRIDLPDPDELPDESFRAVALRRRTHRNFSGTEMDLTTLSTVLHHSFGPVRAAFDHLEETPLAETEPGALRRAGLRVYPVVQRCRDVPPGVYEYAIREHALFRIRKFDTVETADDAVTDAAHRQNHHTDAAVSLFFGSVFDHDQQWCPKSRGLRNSYVHVSEHAHRLILVATALRLRNFVTPALKDTRIDALVGVDGDDEAITYMVAIGE
ncbi:nitroreductase family protein [Natrinema altunense]|uniref:NADH oxidase n=1 Tax=Natrinema altunense (strain JCM 12890 / CGMCC 1.3731 / AJ2) TaxID=1227494 RepID=M0A050_NATA2|nr:nitroreductase family protein [Natrinema altunense]ELY92130.1 NADH oxidase [Natrinema altunense JCM 12890]